MYETRGRIENLIESETTKGNGARRRTRGEPRSATYPLFRKLSAFFHFPCEIFDGT